MGSWAGRRCALWILVRRSSACGGSGGLGPFAAELVVVRGANAADALPRRERRLGAGIAGR